MLQGVLTTRADLFRWLNLFGFPHFLQYYTRLFRDEIGRDPTNVELFDIAQSNSEHSRHWFFQVRWFSSTLLAVGALLF